MHRICKSDTKLGTLNDSSKPGEVLGMDLGHMNEKYMLINIYFFLCFCLVEFL